MSPFLEIAARCAIVWPQTERDILKLEQETSASCQEQIWRATAARGIREMHANQKQASTTGMITLRRYQCNRQATGH